MNDKPKTELTAEEILRKHTGQYSLTKEGDIVMAEKALLAMKEYATLKLKAQQKRGGLDIEAMADAYIKKSWNPDSNVLAMSDSRHDYVQGLEDAICQLSLPEKSEGVDEKYFDIKSSIEQAKARLTFMFPSGENSGAEEIWDCLEAIEEYCTKPVEPNEERLKAELELIRKQKRSLENQHSELIQKYCPAVLPEKNCHSLQVDIDERELTGYEIIEQLEGVSECEENHEHCRFIVKALIPKIKRWFKKIPTNQTVLTPQTLAEALPSDEELAAEIMVKFISRNPHPKSKIYLEYEKKAFIDGVKWGGQQVIEKLSGKVLAKESEINKK